MCLRGDGWSPIPQGPDSFGIPARKFLPMEPLMIRGKYLMPVRWSGDILDTQP